MRVYPIRGGMQVYIFFPADERGCTQIGTHLQDCNPEACSRGTDLSNQQRILPRFV